ncbi:MAG TPA: thioredoxin-like domain-containing protein [Chthoniobacterales bacterium]|nr:thioredoxin-like domain-containing protein [Chthoniobacterales bacterium]
MRLSLSTVVAAAFVSVVFAANLPPLTVKDISLMLRSGYSSDAVEREVAARHFMGTVDATAEKNLAQAGGSPTLIGKLKSGAFAVPAAEAAAVQAELAAKAQRRNAALEESRELDTLYQARVAQTRSAAPPSTALQGAIASLVKGDLVTSRNGVLHPYLDAEFEKKKLIALYRSAQWCAPCRQFTPKLVAYYNQVAAAHPEFEVLFVSNDKSAAAMEGSMRNDQMPWPAVSYDKIAGNAALNKYFGGPIPCLVVVDDTGKVVFDTYAGKNYRGPEAVLADLEKMFAGKGPAQLAEAR